MQTTTYQPALKKVKPINFLFYRTETTVNELNKLFWVASELFQEAVRNKLIITGPIHWHYVGFEGDETKQFTLEISLPVGDVVNEYDGKFHFKRTEDFTCVSLTHEGNWLEIPASYQQIMEFVASHKLVPSGLNRELYINVDFRHPEANVTEIQLGVR